MARRSEISIQPGQVLTRLAGAEAEALAKAWLNVFGRQPAPAMSQYMWHVFSYGSYPSVALETAQRAFAECGSPEYVVLSNERKQAIVTDQKPSSCSLSDYYVFPKNLAWTMAITHEDGWLGPFFAKHPEFSKLNETNLRSLRKAEEAAEARRKGYW